jgi:type IV secretory pathway TraG/TraD family ATPase VirD4
MCLSGREQIIFMRGEPPIRIWQLRYYEHGDMRRRVAALPSYQDTWTIPPIDSAGIGVTARDSESIKV